ncbi:flavin reductase family protein [Loktanella sp. Alg231-35]|uniref:flavin reductase family protein n=1 Tax=Loktanella sp. Alg231-35 TaxID=1922220 RepID=UPI001F3F3318|nr:flavin reductase family protein [Loktanella sp. Alg231-35]
MQTIDRETFIAAMRRVTTSVSVVTTDGPAGRHGATVSAFCSVSADPPTVLVCLHGGSRTAGLVGDNGVFRVNILPAEASAIADRFAGKDDADLTDRFDGIETTGDVPEIAGATSLKCTVTQTVTEGSHLICFGRVTDVTLGRDIPLTYLAGEYCQTPTLEVPR